MNSRQARANILRQFKISKRVVCNKSRILQHPLLVERKPLQPAVGMSQQVKVARYNERAKVLPDGQLPFNTGDVVYWRRPKAADPDLLEDGKHVGLKALPKADGPYEVGDVVSAHSVHLKDPFTGTPASTNFLMASRVPMVFACSKSKITAFVRP